LTHANNESAQRSPEYAVGADFCRIFAQDMDSLYLLALLVTADSEKAEECFAAALEDSAKSNRIFKEWSRSWARRMVIQNAIRMLDPSRSQQEKSSLRPVDIGISAKAESRALLGAVLSLAAFQRCVFVMSVLERYSDQDCSVLLDCSRREIAVAKVQAAEHIASIAGISLPRGTNAVTGVLSAGHPLPAIA
jgi:DNA-directed RNA polymerase specialized sigma24 family protein